MRSGDSFRLLFGSTRILWQNISGYYVSGLWEVCPIEAVACPDDAADFDLITRRSGIRFFSVERRTRVRIPPLERTVEQLVPALKGSIENTLGRHPRDSWVIACPRPCRTLTDFAEAGGYRAAIHPPELGNWLYDKANFFSGLDHLGLPRLRGRWVRLSSTRYSELSTSLGARFVAQLRVGAGGSGTAFVFSEEDFVRAGSQFGDALVWTAPFLGNLSVNVNALAAASGVVIGYPSVQLVGLQDLYSGPGMYCGNDFTATAGLPPETLAETLEQTGRIGHWLSSLGYRGLYGLDFVLDPATSQLYAIDLNPRWQGSTVLSTQAERLAGRLPLAAAEIAYKLGVFGESEVLAHRDDFLKPIRCSQMILHSQASNRARVTGRVLPGVYVNQSGMVRLRDGVELEDCGRSAEFLVTGAVVKGGNRIDHGACMARILSKRQALDPRRLCLLPWARSAAKRLYEQFQLRPVRRGDRVSGG